MLICKICNSELNGNGYCAEHSTAGISYLENNMKKEIKEQIRHILTPPAPRDAREHGGVKDWDYYYNKTGMEFMVDGILELFKAQREEIIEEIEKIESRTIDEKYGVGLKEEQARSQLKIDLITKLKDNK